MRASPEAVVWTALFVVVAESGPFSAVPLGLGQGSSAPAPGTLDNVLGYLEW